MASLNLSINGPSIRSSYQGVVNGSIPSSSPPTYALWALFSVQAPLMNAFQDSGAKESILKVESTGDGELADLIEDFSEGRIQFAYVRLKDPNTALPKNVLIAWCGDGVPERTKGYFTSHMNAVSNVLHGYHVQITARSGADLEPAAIMKKVADASGAKYSAAAAASSAGVPPPVAKKPVFTPTTSSGAGSYNPLVAARRQKQENVDADGWGADAPPVTRAQLEKVESAYRPTRVNMAELTSQRQEPSRFNGTSRTTAEDRADVVKGAYQPVGKVDIAAIRATAAAARGGQDDRPTPVKGAYEPVGKVDIAAIRSRAGKPADDAPAPPPPPAEPAEQPRSLAERSAAFTTQSERLTELPKPKVAKKFGGASAFTGTKAPTPAGLAFGASAVPTAAAPVGAASRTFADQGGKTPAQIWAEKKAAQGGAVLAQAPSAPVASQKSGGGGGGSSEWRSGYTGKSWAPVQAGGYGGIRSQGTGGDQEEEEAQPEEPSEPSEASGDVSSLRGRFKDAAPMGGAAPAIPARGVPDEEEEEAATPRPPPPAAARPGAPPGGFAMPGLPSRPPPPEEEPEEEEESAYPEREESPPRVAVPVPRGPEPEMEPPAERYAPAPVPAQEIEEEEEEEAEAEELPREEERPEEEQATHDLARGAAAAVAGGKTAIVQYDYERAEDNEIELREGEYVTNIDMVDDDWWMGTNAQGETGLFPSNYVELVEGGAAPPPPRVHEPEPEPEPEPEHAADGGYTATAQFDYEAAEDNELSFPEGARITDLEFPDEDWWFGHYGGHSGLFPANYVEREN